MYILRKNSHGFSEANHYLNVKADHSIQLICKLKLKYFYKDNIT